MKKSILKAERRFFPSFEFKFTPAVAVKFVAQCLLLFLFASVPDFGYALALALLCGLVYARQNLLTLAPPFVAACCVFQLSWWSLLYTLVAVLLLVGLYLLVPVIIRVKRDVSERAFSRLTWIFLAVAVISFETGSRSLSWDIGLSFYYVGYLLAGYEIKRRIGGRKHTGGGILLILAGLGVEAIAAFMRYRQAIAGISDTELEYQYLKPLSPLIVAGSLLIFTGFSLIYVKRDFSKLASYTFLIYLIHAFVWNNLARKVIARRIGLEGDSRILIPACVILVFLISLLLAVLYTKLWNFFAGQLTSAAKNRKLFHKKFSAKKI